MKNVVSVVNVYSGGPHGKPEGQARIVEVRKYISNGWYRIKGVLLSDPYAQVRTLYFNIQDGGGANK